MPLYLLQRGQLDLLGEVSHPRHQIGEKLEHDLPAENMVKERRAHHCNRFPGVRRKGPEGKIHPVRCGTRNIPGLRNIGRGNPDLGNPCGYTEEAFPPSRCCVARYEVWPEELGGKMEENEEHLTGDKTALLHCIHMDIRTHPVPFSGSQDKFCPL